MATISMIVVTIIQILAFIFGCYYFLNGFGISDNAQSAMHQIYAATTCAIGAICMGVFALICVLKAIYGLIERNGASVHYNLERAAKGVEQLKETLVKEMQTVNMAANSRTDNILSTLKPRDGDDN